VLELPVPVVSAVPGIVKCVLEPAVYYDGIWEYVPEPLEHAVPAQSRVAESHAV
jgi:hypothetical protein